MRVFESVGRNSLGVVSQLQYLIISVFYSLSTCNTCSTSHQPALDVKTGLTTMNSFSFAPFESPEMNEEVKIQ